MILTVGDVANDIVVRRFVDQIDAHSDTPAIVTQSRGGSAANVAMVSARLGRPARFLGPIGSDVTGEWLRSQLRESDVDVVGVEAERSISIVVLVDPAGGRQFLTDRPQNIAWEAIANESMLESILVGVNRVHLTGYALCDPLATTLCTQLTALASRMSIPVSLDPSSVAVLRSFGIKEFQRLVGNIAPDIFLPNADEAELMGGWTAPHFTVTSHGASPTTITRTGAPVEMIDVAVCEVVDTTGAGDALAAGLLDAYDRGATIGDAVRYGHAASRRVITGSGADHWSVD